jgi:hypothetical protein
MESLQAIRQSCKIPHVKQLTASEARQRVREPPSISAKSSPAPPTGRHGDLWWGFYRDAMQRSHPDPEKMADSALRARERTLALKEARHKVVITLDPPKSQETVVAPKKVQSGIRCNAMTLSGKRCGFKAACGDFCKKHAI